jgi:hypothetical protein
MAQEATKNSGHRILGDLVSDVIHVKLLTYTSLWAYRCVLTYRSLLGLHIGAYGLMAM